MRDGHAGGRDAARGRRGPSRQVIVYTFCRRCRVAIGLFGGIAHATRQRVKLRLLAVAALACAACHGVPGGAPASSSPSPPSSPGPGMPGPGTPAPGDAGPGGRGTDGGAPSVPGDGGAPDGGGPVTPPVGPPPGSIFPAQFFIGIVSLDAPDQLQWLMNRPLWARYLYLNNGFTNGWANITPTPGDYARTYIRNSKKLGMIPAFVWYQIPGDAGEGFTVDAQHAADVAYMTSYFQNYKLLLDIINTEGGPALIILEPDFWGYLQQNQSSAPDQIPAKVGATGLAYTAGYPDTVAGLGACLLGMARALAPGARLGFEVSLWATNGHPVTGLVYDTPANVQAAATATAAFHRALGADHADFWVAEKNGFDAGGWAAAGAGRMWYWQDAQMENYLLFVKTFTDALQRPALGWQIPIGHTGLPNTVNQYEDTFAEYLFRLQNNQYVNIPKFIAAGFRGILFGGGVGQSTTVLSDGGWFGDRVAEYAKAPVTIQ
jgi:hypothetical protein